MAGQILESIVITGLLLSVAIETASAQMPMPPSQPTQAFRSIEQPLAVKIGVTIGGLGLIGLELWWFLLSKSRAQKAGVGSQASPPNTRKPGAGN